MQPRRQRRKAVLIASPTLVPCLFFKALTLTPRLPRLQGGTPSQTPKSCRTAPCTNRPFPQGPTPMAPKPPRQDTTPELAIRPLRAFASHLARQPPSCPPALKPTPLLQGAYTQPPRTSATRRHPDRDPETLLAGSTHPLAFAQGTAPLPPDHLPCARGPRPRATLTITHPSWPTTLTLLPLLQGIDPCPTHASATRRRPVPRSRRSPERPLHTPRPLPQGPTPLPPKAPRLERAPHARPRPSNSPTDYPTTLSPTAQTTPD